MSVHGAPQGFPLPASSVPSTRPSSTSPPSEQIIYVRNFLGETLNKLGFNEVVPLPTSSELGRDLSTGESIVLPLLCSTINALASLLERVDTLNDRITHTHDSISQVANSVPNRDELTASLAPITSSVRDLSHRVSTAPVPHRPAPPLTNQAPAPPPSAKRPSAPTPGLHPDFPRHDHTTNRYYGNPEAFAKSHPTSWEASHFANGGYPAASTFLPGVQDPTCPRLTYAQATAPTTKGKRKSSPQGVASLTSPPSSSSSPASSSSSKPSTLLAAARRFYAPRQDPLPHPDRETIAATFPDIAAEVLRSSNCAFPLSFTAKVNSNGTVTLLGISPFTPASDYAPFFGALAARLNKSFPVGSSLWLPFRPAPNENQFAIHGLPLRYLPEDNEGLFVYLRTAILNAKGVKITSARFLNPDPVARSLKLASSVVVTTTPEEGKKMGSNIFLLSRKREIKTAHSANKTTRCRNCQRYGHTAPVCKYDHPVCSICALQHRKTEHRCPNPTCPKEGNLHPVANCCSASPAHCANCGDDHPATHPTCPARPSRPPPTGEVPLAQDHVAPAPAEGDMDTTEDEGEAVAETPRPSAPSTVRRLLPAFEVVTPRPTRPSAPPSVLRPTPGAGGPLPQVAPSPSPAPSNDPGRAQ